MTRSGYSDDCPHLGLYRSSVERALAGRRGQAFLTEALAALDALPERRLIADEFTDGADCCLLGAVALARGETLPNDAEPDELGARLGIAPSMAAELMYVNDEWPGPESDEQRFERVRGWLVAKLLRRGGS